MTLRAVQPNSISNEPSSDPSAVEGEDSTKKTTKKLWMAALKPPMYCVAVMPICVGSAVAYAETSSFRWDVFLIFSLSAILLLVWENLSNDVFDAATGIDVNKHHSLVNLTHNRPLIFWIGNAALFLGVAGILSISLLQQDATQFVIILGISFAAGEAGLKLG